MEVEVEVEVEEGEGVVLEEGVDVGGGGIIRMKVLQVKGGRQGQATNIIKKCTGLEKESSDST